MARIPIIIAALMIATLAGKGQDTLPRFSLINKGNERIIVSWTNPYGQNLRQLSIQRSFDSLRNFTTILTLPDPTVVQNGYVDTKAINDHMFYRLYILLDSGRYSFSVSKRPKTDASFPNTDFTGGDMGEGQGKFIGINKPKDLQRLENSAARYVFVKKKDVLIGAIPENFVKSFKDSITYRTRDTVFMQTADTILIGVFSAKEYFRPSKYIFTEKDGNIKISLSDAGTRKYAVKFFEEDHTPVFEIRQIKDAMIIVDKTNFVHSGWFNFELYEDGVLKEKHKFFVPREF